MDSETNHDSEPLTSVDNGAQKKPRRIGSSVEFLMFTFFVAKTLSDTVVVNLMERTTCLVVLNYDTVNCTEPVSPTTQGVLQQSTANLLMARTMIEAFVPSLLTLFIGSWSDTNGRRPLMLMSLIGYTSSVALWCGLSLIPGLNPIYFLLPSIPVALGGGYTSFFLALYCYISDVTKMEQRAVRMGWLEAACLLGVLVSSLVTPYLLQTSVQFGFSIVFATSFLLLFLTLLYTYYFVEESVNIIESERKRLWRLNHVKEIFTTCFKDRPNYTRAIVMVIIANLVISIEELDGELAVLYMFTQKKFSWTLVDYTRFSSFFIVVAGTSVVVSTWLFTSVLKLSDLIVMFLGTMCMLSKALMQALATQGYIFYVSTCFNIMTVLITPLSRSQLSKLIPQDELGKIFAFTAFLESTAPLTASPLYLYVYKTTMDTHTSAVFWLSTGLSYFSVLLIGSTLVLSRLSSNREFRSLPTLSDEVENNSIQA